MKIAVLGDIHSNYIALEECIKWIYANDIYGIAFLGDYISDCPYPERTMQILRSIPTAYKTWFVRGNREDYMLEHRKNLTEDWRYCSQSGSLLYTYENLSGSDLRSFEDMPIGMEIKLDGYPPFSICHATMQSTRELIFEDSPQAERVMDEMTTFMQLCGHEHTPYIKKRGAKTLVNAGCVGFSQNGVPGAHFAVIESNGGDWEAKPVTVGYDVEAVIAGFYESGLIEKANVWSRAAIASLRESKNYNGECVKLVKKMSQELDEPFDSEELWQKAAEQLGI